MNQSPNLLLINPWIYDFAAHDVFARPLGLLYLAGFLRAQGYRVELIDCLQRGPQDPIASPAGRHRTVTGRYPKKLLPTPPSLYGVLRHYGRYGISEAAFRLRLADSSPPAAVLVTSLMTYWYPGVFKVIRLVREYFPQVPILLGGIYATLCPEHARLYSGADRVIAGPGEEDILSTLDDLIGVSPLKPDLVTNLDGYPYPALDLLPDLNFIPLLTSRGCPLACSYCASRLLQPRFHPRRPQAVIEEINFWQMQLGLREVAFYDDALLVDADNHLLPILAGLVERGLDCRFHTPNGLHVGLITPRVARWLKKANFSTLRLGLETVAVGEERLDRKVQAGELERALRALQAAGFTPKELGVYLLIGLPGQQDAQVEESIRRVRALGATPVLTQYSPIPHTALWPAAIQASRFDLAADPLYHNNSIFPCWPAFSWPRYSRLKNLTA